MFEDVHKWMNKEVELIYNGIIYRGLLIEITHDYTLLRRRLGYASVPTNEITSIRLIEEDDSSKGRRS